MVHHCAHEELHEGFLDGISPTPEPDDDSHQGDSDGDLDHSEGEDREAECPGQCLLVAGRGVDAVGGDEVSNGCGHCPHHPLDGDCQPNGSVLCRRWWDDPWCWPSGKLADS